MEVNGRRGILITIKTGSGQGDPLSSILFLIGLEPLNRLIANLGSNGVRPVGVDKKGQAEAKKLSTAAIHVATTEDKPTQLSGEAKRCKFADVLGCPGQHAPWRGAGHLEV